MALTADNVRVAVTGAVYTAPTGTTAPTTPAAAFGAGWVDLGYVSEDGVTESYNEDTTDIKAWQGGTTVRTLTSSTTAQLHLTLIESSNAVLEVFHKGSTITTDTGNSTLEVGPPVEDKRAFALDVIDGDTHVRILVANGEVTERGDVVYKNDEPIGYEITITCYPDADNVVMVKLSDSDAWAAA